MRLTDEELRDVLARAEEIQGGGPQAAQVSAELEAVITAGEEVGLTRPAMEQAIRERLLISATPPSAGTLTFAKSADDKFYLAEVLGSSSEGVRVRFLRGSEHLVTLDQLRPASLIPGERVVVDWPWWGPWTCTVVSYDAAKKRVKLSDGSGSTKWFPISDVWLAARKPTGSGARTRVYATLAGAGAAVGALIGSIITALLIR